jgi:hypothetical protein
MTVPSADISVLHRADGSAQYSAAGYTVVAAVNGPLEVGRRDELPQHAALEVIVRPSVGVGSKLPIPSTLQHPSSNIHLHRSQGTPSRIPHPLNSTRHCPHPHAPSHLDPIDPPNRQHPRARKHPPCLFRTYLPLPLHSHPTLTQPLGPLTPPSPPKRLHPRFPQRLYSSDQYIHLHHPLHLALWFHLCQPCSQSFALGFFNPRIRFFVGWKVGLGFKRGRVRYCNLGKSSR